MPSYRRIDARLILWLQITLIVCIASNLGAQQNLSIEVPSVVQWCDPVVYNYSIQNNGANTSDERLELRFSQNVEFLSTAGNLTLIEESPRFLAFDINKVTACNYVEGFINVIPNCTSNPLPVLETTSNLGILSSTTSQQSYSTVIQTPTLSLRLGEYQYDATTNTLTKNIDLTNLGSNKISIFDIDISAPEDFVTLINTTVGAISDNHIIFDETNFSGLAARSTETITLTYLLNDCSIAPILYDLKFTCPLNGCALNIPFVDDNETSANDITINGIPQYQFGICEPEYNTLIIKNNRATGQGRLNDTYDVEVLLSYINMRTNDCQEIDFLINNNSVSYSNGDSVYIVGFDDMFNDPDGAGGLSDLDGDGLYDDLAAGDSISLQYGIRFYEECAERTGSRDNIILATVRSSSICGRLTDGNIMTIGPTVLFPISDISWMQLPKDETGRRFISVGDTLPWEINFRGVLPAKFLNCENPTYILEYYTPPNLIWIESLGIIFTSWEDSISRPLTYELRDTVITLDVTDLPRGLITINYEGICPPDALIDVDPGLPLHLQCIEWNDYDARARINILCEYDDSCEPTENFREVRSTKIRTSCLELQEDYANISTTGIILNRMNGGWMDQNRTVKWDPDIHGKSGNNDAYYDHDTMRALVPFTFNRATGLSRLRIYIGNRLNSQEIDLEMLTSTVKRYDRTTGNLIEECDARARTIDVFRSTTLELSSLDFDNFCINPQDSMVWEVFLELNVERSPSLESNGFRQEDLTFYIEELTDGCWKSTSYSESSYVVSEVFIPRLFRVSGTTQFFNGSADIGDQLPIGISTNIGLGNLAVYQLGAGYIYENRTPFSVSELTFSVPYGYELLNDELIITLNKDSIYIISPAEFSLGRSDTIDILTPLNKVETASETLLTFLIDEDYYTLASIDEYINISTTIQSYCPPILSPSLLSITGSLDYVDHYTGTIETTDYNINLEEELNFMSGDILIEDNFKIKSTSALVNWRLNQVIPLFSRLFGNTNLNSFTIEYFSNGSRINGINRFFSNDSPQVPDTAFRLPLDVFSDSLISFSLDDSTEALYSRSESYGFELLTSDHRCGYDTLIYRIGSSILWERGLCLESAFTDTIITYTPVGIPSIKLDSVPTELNLCGRSRLLFDMNNIGEGGMTSPTITIRGPRLVDPTILISADNTDPITINNLNYDNGAYVVHLSAAGLDTMYGLRDDTYKSYQGVLSWELACESPSRIDLGLQLGVTSYCGEVATTTAVNTGELPVVHDSDDEIEVTLQSYVDQPCDNNVRMRLSLSASNPVSLDNDSIVIILPANYPYKPGSTLLDGQLFADPIINYNDDQQLLSWSDVMEDLSESMIITFELDGTCADVCGRGETQAFVISNAVIDCETVISTCERSMVVGYSGMNILDWRPRWNLDLTDQNIITTANNQSTVGIEMIIEQVNIHSYEDVISLYYYIDLNQNGSFDAEDNLIRTTTKVFPIGQQLSSSDTLSISNDLLCDLSLAVSSSPTCGCSQSSIDIDLFGNSGRLEIASLCGGDIIDLSDYINSNCTEVTSNNSNINITNQTITYNRDNTRSYMTPDTVVILQLCESCDMSDTILISDDLRTVDIVTSNIDCEVGEVTLSAITNGENASNLTYSWNNAPAQDSSTLVITESGVVGLTVISSSGCTASDSIFIEVDELTYDINVAIDQCLGDTVGDVDIVITSTAPTSVIWQDGYEGPVRQGLSPGVYPITLQSGGCILQDEITIIPIVPIDIMYPSMISLDQDERATIIPLSGNNGDLTFSWSGDVQFSCTDCGTPTIFTNNSATISVLVTNPEGCEVIRDISVTVKVLNGIYIPNTFAPESTVNNRFIPSAHPSIRTIRFIRVYDRWGNQVFNQENISPVDTDQGWDGTFNDVPLGSGVYSYHILLQYVDGSEEDNVGTVTLLR